MKFKLYYDDSDKLFKINCIADEKTTIRLPNFNNQHIMYPIPNHLLDIAVDDMNSLLDNLSSKTDEYREVNNEINRLIKKRNDLLSEIRKETNPRIMKTCENFKMNHPEEFI